MLTDICGLPVHESQFFIGLPHRHLQHFVKTENMNALVFLYLFSCQIYILSRNSTILYHTIPYYAVPYHTMPYTDLVDTEHTGKIDYYKLFQGFFHTPTALSRRDAWIESRKIRYVRNDACIFYALVIYNAIVMLNLCRSL